MKRKLRSNRDKAGFSIVEVLISLTIVSISFLVTYGTISSTLTQSSRILGETKGATLIQQIVLDIGNGITARLTKSPAFKISLPAALNTGPLGASTSPYYFFDYNGVFLSSGTTAPTNSVYRASVSINEVTTAPSNVYIARIVIYFPAQVDPHLGYPNSVNVVTELTN